VRVSHSVQTTGMSGRPSASSALVMAPSGVASVKTAAVRGVRTGYTSTTLPQSGQVSVTSSPSTSVTW
jgi:hypothetical protein